MKTKALALLILLAACLPALAVFKPIMANRLTVDTNDAQLIADITTLGFGAGGGGGMTSVTNNGVVSWFTPLGFFYVSNTLTHAYTLVGTNGHVTAQDQYGNLRQWTTNQFRVDVSTPSGSKTLLWSNGTLFVDGAITVTNGADATLKSLKLTGVPTAQFAVVLSDGTLGSTLDLSSGTNLNIANVNNAAGRAANLTNANNQIYGNFYGNFNGIANGSYRGSQPLGIFAFADSITENLRTNGWLSQGGYSNQWSQGTLTNGYLYYNVGSYAANNISYVDVLTNMLWQQQHVPMQVDLAGAVPGLRGSDIWGAFDGTNYISLTSLQANAFYDQTHGFTYNSSGVSSQVVHGCPYPLTFWPGGADDVSFTVQGNTYTNINNSPISFTVTGGSYVTITFNGTANFTTTATVTLPYMAGGGGRGNTSPKYGPPYTSAVDQFNFSGGNIPVGLWADTNAPIYTGKPQAAIVQWGNNDYLITTNAGALWANQAAYGNHLHAIGFFPVLLVGTFVSPAFDSVSGLTATNFANLQRANWRGPFDGFYDVMQVQGASGNLLQHSNYMDDTHFTLLYAGQNATNAFPVFGFNNLLPTAAQGVGPVALTGVTTNGIPAVAAGQVATWNGSAFTASNLPPPTYQQMFTALGAYGGIINTNLTCAGATISTNIGLTAVTGLTMYITNASRNSGSIFINFTGGTFTTTTNMFDINFGCTYSNAPNVVIAPANFNAANAVNGYKSGAVQTLTTTTKTTYYFAGNVLVANTPYLYSFVVGQGIP